MERLNICIFIVSDTINKSTLENILNISESEIEFSDFSHLVYHPVGNDAAIYFKFSVFIDIDLPTLVNALKRNVIYDRFRGRFNGVNFTIFSIFGENEMTPDIEAFIRNTDQILKGIKDPQIQYHMNQMSRKIYSNDRIIPKSSVDMTPEKPLKEPKIKFKEGKEKNKEKSSVWKSISDKDKKKIYGQLGYLATSELEPIEKDVKIIEKFIDRFIPDDSNFAEKFKKDLLKRWSAIYVRYVK